MSKTLQIQTAKIFEPLLGATRYKGAFGGRGSGKSHFFAELAVERCLQQPGTRIVCVREVQKSLRESVKLLVEDKIDSFGVGPQFRIKYESITTPGGGVILFQGMQDHTADSIKSLEGFDIGYVEEAQTITQRSLEFLRPTIRKPNSEIWFSWNPRHASDPVDAFLRGPAPPTNAAMVRANYINNPFFPDVLEDERAYDEANARDRYGHIWLGDYEPAAIGAIWDRLTLHQGRVEEPPAMTRIVVAVDPAVSSNEGSNEHGIVVVGIGTDGRGYVLDDVSMKGGPQQWAERTIATYDRYEADAVVIEINQGGDMVRHTLRSVRPGLRVIEVRATRGKHVRAEPIAALYSMGRISHVGAFPELEDDMCLMTAAGYEGEGSPDRCLAAGTIIETARGSIPIECVEAGDQVLTRSGYRRVTAAKKTGTSVPVCRVLMSGGRTLVGTRNHPVFVEGKGFLRLDALVRDDILATCKKKRLSSMAERILGTQSRLTDLPGSISITRLTVSAVTVVAHYIGILGNVITGLSPLGALSTIRMTTRSTTAWATLSALLMLSTQNAILKRMNLSSAEWTMRGFLLALGTVARRGWSSIADLGLRVGRIESPLPATAMNVVMDMRPCLARATSGSARRHAAIDGGRKTALTASKGDAKPVTGRSWRGDQRNNDAAHVSVLGLSDAGLADVFNLTVEQDNEYFANGVLVHNCDALVWGLSELFPRLTRKTDNGVRRMPYAEMAADPRKRGGGAQMSAEMRR